MARVPNHRAWTSDGMPISSPRAETSFTVADAVRMKRNRARSRIRPMAGPATTTERTKAAHVGQWCVPRVS